MRRIIKRSTLVLQLFLSALFISSESFASSVKILFIGIDGADKKIIEKLVNSGDLPNIASVIARGEMYGLKPEDRFSTSIWTSMLTGEKSDVHGIISFIGLNKNNQIVLSPPSYMRKVKALWNILTDKQIKSLFISFTCTWPVEEIYGYMVSQLAIPQAFFYKNTDLVKKSSFQRFFSFDTQDYASSSFKWSISSMIPAIEVLIEEMNSLNIPIEFSFANVRKMKRIVNRWYRKELHKLLQVYKIDNPIVLPYTTIFSSIDSRKLPLLSYVSDKLSTDIAIKVMKDDHQLDVVGIYLPGLDIFQEYLLTDGKLDGRYKNNIGYVFNYYKFVDYNIGRLIKNINEDTKIVIVSDHGIGIDLVKKISDVREGIFICSEKLNLNKKNIVPHEVFHIVLNILNL